MSDKNNDFVEDTTSTPNDNSEPDRIKLQILDSNVKHAKINEHYRFALLALGCMGCICTSFGMAYNLLSGEFQKLLNLNQIDLVNINVVGQVFGHFGLPFAFIYDYFGPRPVAAICMTMLPLGAILISLTFVHVIQGSVVRLCVFNGIMSISTILFDMTGNVTVVTYFPTMRGPTIALLKSFVGLGSSIVGAIQLGFFETNFAGFLYFLSCYAFLMGLLLVIFMRLPAYQLTGYQNSHLDEEEKERRLATKAQFLYQKPPMWRFLYGYALLISMIIFLVTSSACVNYKKLGKSYKVGFAVVAIILTLMVWGVTLIPQRVFKCVFGRCVTLPRDSDDSTEEGEQYLEGPRQDDSNDISPEFEKEFVVGREFGVEPVEEATKAAVVETEEDYIAPQYQTSFLRNLLTLRLWFIVWTLFCLTGAEFVCINNSSYIYGAIDGKKVPQDLRTMLTVINGAGSAVGRLIMAAFEYFTQNRPLEKRIPLTWAPMIPTCTIIVCMIFFLTLPAIALPLPYVLIAIANGAQAAQTVLVPRTIYAKDPAKHYNFCFIACMCSSVVFVRFLYGEWYYRQGLKRGADGYCFGRNCVMMPFIVLLCLVVSTVFSNMYVHLKYSFFVKKVLKERRRLREENQEENQKEHFVAVADDLADN